MNKPGYILSTVLLACVCVSQEPKAGSAVETREVREIKMAEQSILASLAVSMSPKGRHLCTDDDLACLGADKAELGLALIGARRTPASLRSLAAVMRFTLDGSLGEDYPCYVMQKGPSIRPFLLALKPAQMQKQCFSELSSLTKNIKSLEGLNPDSVCSSPQSMKAQIQEFLQAIARRTQCDPGDF